jgi:Domain of unknown function (DUF4124)
MRRQAIALAAWVALSALVLPSATWAAGKALASAPANANVQPDFRQNGAFGLPGGFPFPRIEVGQGGGSPHPMSRQVPRLQFFPRFPSTVFFATPSALLAPLSDVPSPVVTVAPVVNVNPTVYVAPPLPAPPPAPVAAVPVTVPAPPSVVEHATGRYELRGDGIGTPYVWVWIPNPPAAPPAAGAAREDPPAAASRSEIYRWTDEQGTTFWTNRREQVPERYRSRASGSAQVATQP